MGNETFYGDGLGESTSYVGELVVGELTRWRNDRYSQYPRLLAKEGTNACMENQKGRENEKSTTRGIPRRSPIQILTPPDSA